TEVPVRIASGDGFINRVRGLALARRPAYRERVVDCVVGLVRPIEGSRKVPIVPLPVRETLRAPQRLLASLVVEEVPDPTAAGAGEQPQLPVADLAPQELQHRLWVCGLQPLLLRHGRNSLPKSKSTTQQPRT